MQLNMLDMMRSEARTVPVDPDGPVILGEIDEVLELPEPRMAWSAARIELHRHTDGSWMWSTSYQTNNRGGGYRVGPKWGRFAETRDDALHHACRELEAILSRIDVTDHPRARDITKWIARLR